MSHCVIMWIGFVFTVVSSWEENDRNEMAVLIKAKTRKQGKAVLLVSFSFSAEMQMRWNGQR